MQPAVAAADAAAADAARSQPMHVGNVIMVFHAMGATPPQDTFRCGKCQTVLQRQNLTKHKPGTGIQCTRQAQRVASRQSRAAEVSVAAGADAETGPAAESQCVFGAIAIAGPGSGVFGQKRDRSVTQATDATSPDVCPHCKLSIDLPFCALRGVPHSALDDMEEDIGEVVTVERASAARPVGGGAQGLPIGAVPRGARTS
eukprot:gene19649-biopygen14578